MSKPVLFHGKPNQVDDVLTHCLATFAANGVTDPGQQAGYLASLFRGSALTWLTTTLKENDSILVDYTSFVQQVRQRYELNEHARAGQLARQLASCRQRRSVQDYATEFEPLSKACQLSDSVAIATFVKGLKPHVQRALVTSDDYVDLSSVIAEATRIDSELYNIRRSGGYNPTRFSSTRDGKGRFKKSRHSIKTESN